MALWFSRSRLANHLIRKMGSSQNLKRSSWISSSSLLNLWNPSLIHGIGRNPPAVLENLKTHSADCRFASTKAGEERDTRCDDDENQGDSPSEGGFLHSNSQFPVRICGDDDFDKNLNLYQLHTCPKKVLDFPGGRVMFTYQLKFISESPEKRADCFRVLDDNGQPIAGNYIEQVNKEVAVKMYGNMVTLQIMDTIFYEAQRQGRISFYVTSNGEEAINIASAAALTIDDLIFPQYREPGVLLWRGFSLQEFANQCFSNKADYGKGRQMPIHYGSNKLNYFTVSSTIATQIPQAVGAAYSLKMDQKNACAVTYFGDGGTSEGDFHAALNFAAVMEAPVIFFCRNNGWAISTPTSEQFRSDGLVVRGPAYGIRSIRVDGNDALAVYCVVRAAREMAINECRPILVEALTYRAGHHSTSDDSTKYRPVDEIEHWKTMRDPVSRFRKWVEGNGWWSEVDESELRSDVRKKILDAIQAAEKAEKPPLADLFTDVYSDIPSNLREQERSIRETVQKHPQDYPPDVPV